MRNANINGCDWSSLRRIRVLQVERFFAEITTKRIRRTAFRSLPALERAIRNYLDAHNDCPKPFRWTADADNILRRVANVCERTFGSGH